MISATCWESNSWDTGAWGAGVWETLSIPRNLIIFMSYSTYIWEVVSSTTYKICISQYSWDYTIDKDIIDVRRRIDNTYKTITSISIDVRKKLISRILTNGG